MLRRGFSPELSWPFPQLRPCFSPVRSLCCRHEVHGAPAGLPRAGVLRDRAGLRRELDLGLAGVRRAGGPGAVRPAVVAAGRPLHIDLDAGRRRAATPAGVSAADAARTVGASAGGVEAAERRGSPRTDPGLHALQRALTGSEKIRAGRKKILRVENTVL